MMQAALSWIPVAGCAIAVIYLLRAVFGDTTGVPQIQTALATTAIAFAVVPCLLAKALQAALPRQE